MAKKKNNILLEYKIAELSVVPSSRDFQPISPSAARSARPTGPERRGCPSKYFCSLILRQSVYARAVVLSEKGNKKERGEGVECKREEAE